MSVLHCGRKNCTNIMCDRLILNGETYICDECFSELQESRCGWVNNLRKSRVEELIREFMQSPIGSHINLDSDGIDAEFQRLTTSRYKEVGE